MNCRRLPPDYVLLTVALVMVVLGIWLVLNASYPRAAGAAHTHGDPFFFAKRQGVGACIGFIAMLAAMKVPYWKWRRLSWAGVIVSVILLILVFVPKVGVKANGAWRWIDLPGIPFQIQSSEVAKLALVLFSADIGAKRREKAVHPKHGLGIQILVLSLVAGLVVLEPDLGTALVLLTTWGALAIVCGIPRRTAAVLAASVAAVVALECIRAPYKMGRLLAFLDPWKYYHGAGYQIIHSLTALGSGGFWGCGIGNGLQKYYFLPAVHTDFIVATLGEEKGLAGTLAMLLLFAVLSYRGFSIASGTKDAFGSLLAFGITTCITAQALLNFAVVSAFAPTTGVPLPLISYGGSSLVLTMFAVGVVLNVSMHPDRVVEEVASSSINRRNRGTYISRAYGGRSSA
ncbi:MAG: putative lipid II flippase FtsW [Armatimonadota bacterium]